MHSKGYHLTYEKARRYVLAAGITDPDRFLLALPLKMVHGAQIGMIMFRVLDIQDRMGRLGFRAPDIAPFLTKYQRRYRKQG